MKKAEKQGEKPVMEFRQSLFWDVDPKTIDPEKNARYVIERVLEFGRPDETRWLFAYYPKETIKKVMALPRAQIGLRSKALWSLLLN
jgi:hypothetical protein